MSERLPPEIEAIVDQLIGALKEEYKDDPMILFGEHLKATDPIKWVSFTIISRMSLEGKAGMRLATMLIDEAVKFGIMKGRIKGAEDAARDAEQRVNAANEVAGQRLATMQTLVETLRNIRDGKENDGMLVTESVDRVRIARRQAREAVELYEGVERS